MRIIEGDLIAWDTETTGVRVWHGDKPFAFSFCNERGETAYIEFPVEPFTREPIYDRRIDDIAEILSDSAVRKVGHNIKFDIRMARAAGITVSGEINDTMFSAHVCNSQESSFGLKELCQTYRIVGIEDLNALKKAAVRLRLRAKKLGWKIYYEPRFDATEDLELPEDPLAELRNEDNQDVLPKRAKPEVAADYWLGYTMHSLHPEKAIPGTEGLCEQYATLDSFRTMMLFLFYQEKMEEMGVRHTYDFEMFHLWEVVFGMEDRGVRFHPDRNRKEMVECQQKARHYRREVESKAWPGFDIDSHEDIRTLLFDVIQLPVNPAKLTPKTQLPSVNAKALDELKDHEIVRNILRYRARVKAYSSFFAKFEHLKERVVDDGGFEFFVLHPNYNQLGARTARFSCYSPNMQQVTSVESARSFEPIDARGPFGPREGFVWLHLDYKGQEVRIFADCSQEPNMMEAIWQGREIHDEVTNKAWGGVNNALGIKETVHALGLDGSAIGGNKKILELYTEWGIDYSDIPKLDRNGQEALAAVFLATHNWDIIASQAAIDKKQTKDKAKVITFIKIYGGGVPAAQKQLHMPMEEVREFMQNYDATFPRIKQYSKELQKQALLDGGIWNRWDRWLRVPADKSYKAVNYMVQGTAADQIKDAMVRCHQFFRDNDIDAHVLMTVHDEIIFEIRKEYFTVQLVHDLQDIMEDTGGRISVPMPTDPSVSRECWTFPEKLACKKKRVA